MNKARLLCLLALLVPATSALAQSGKIAGEITEAATGQPLPGVNVVIDGTTQGAVTDVDGYYSIIGVRPGTYDVRASFIGFTAEVVQGVRVNLDLTTEVDFALREEAVGLDEVTVIAERPVVQRDVSANVANFSAEEVENMPVTGVDEVIDLQAGIEPGLRIRGGGLNEVSFMVDGMSTAVGRDQQPFTNISFTSVSEVQVQTGGFNAEYGNARSGIINVVTKDPPRDRYTADVLFRYAPAQQKYFGDIGPDDPRSQYLRPFLDTTDSLAYKGVGVLDEWERQRFDDFKGWEEQVQKNQTNADSTDDHLTADDLMEIYRYRTRRDPTVTTPDLDIDATVGGPLPGLSKYLGDLRFLGSYRQQQRAYLVPLERDAYTAYTGQLKLVSNITPAIRFVASGTIAQELGMNASNNGSPTIYNGEMPKYAWDDRNYIHAIDASAGDVFGIGSRALMDINRSTFGLEVTHTLSSNTFYEVKAQRQYTDYFSRPGFRLDQDVDGDGVQEKDEVVTEISGYGVNAAPLGFDGEPGQQDAIGGRWLSQRTLSRDTSDVTTWTGSFDVTSQLNRYAQVKAGVEYIYNDYDTNHGVVDSFHVHHANPWYSWQRQPTQGAAYGQTKLEFQGMVANLGLRLDYFHAAGDWYSFQGPYDPALAAYGIDALEEQIGGYETTERQFALSPRLGIAFPITENSKLYFNYGHFRQMLNPRNLYAVETSYGGKITEIGNPNHTMPKTVSYEVGYEHNLFDQFLVRLTGYYKDVSQESRQVRYTNLDGQVNYQIRLPLNYQDVRGAELTLAKNRGKFVRGFVNLTYLSKKEGNFGYNRQFQNPVEQRSFERAARNYLDAPVAEPFARFNIEFLGPEDFGPEVAGVRPLGDWRVSFLGEWRAGQTFTYTGGQDANDVSGIRDNMQWKDYYNLDLRFAKNFSTIAGEAQFFADVTNVLNLRRLSRHGAWGPNFGFERYMESLHLPREVYENNEGELVEGAPIFIEGDDRPGDFRKPGAEFVPIVIQSDIASLPETGHERPLYYVGGQYYEWDGSAYVTADEGYVEQVLDDKAYIDMPAIEWKRFLNPRHVLFGLRLTF